MQELNLVFLPWLSDWGRWGKTGQPEDAEIILSFGDQGPPDFRCLKEE